MTCPTQDQVLNACFPDDDTILGHCTLFRDGKHLNEINQYGGAIEGYMWPPIAVTVAMSWCIMV